MCRLAVVRKTVSWSALCFFLVMNSNHPGSATSCILNDNDCYDAWTAISTQLRFETKGKCSKGLQFKVDYAYTVCQLPTCRERTIPYTRLQYLKGWWSPTIGLSKTIGNDFDHPSPQDLVQVSLADFNCSNKLSKTRLRIESYYQSAVCSGLQFMKTSVELILTTRADRILFPGRPAYVRVVQQEMDLFSLNPTTPPLQQCFPYPCRPSIAGFFLRVDCYNSATMPDGVYLVNRSWAR